MEIQQFSQRFYRLWSRLFISVLILQSTTSCQLPDAFKNQSECNKNSKSAFRSCVKEKFPIGSSYSELKTFLLKDGFKELDHAEQNRFYFRWRPIPWLGNFSNYTVIVVGEYDENLEIVELIDD